MIYKRIQKLFKRTQCSVESIRLFEQSNLKMTDTKYVQPLNTFGKRYWFFRSIAIVSYVVRKCSLPTWEARADLCERVPSSPVILRRAIPLFRVFLEMFHGIHRERLGHLDGRSSVFLSPRRGESKSFLKIDRTMRGVLKRGLLEASFGSIRGRINTFLELRKSVNIIRVRRRTCGRVCARSRLKGGKDSFRDVPRMVKLPEIFARGENLNTIVSQVAMYPSRVLYKLLSEAWLSFRVDKYSKYKKRCNLSNNFRIEELRSDHYVAPYMFPNCFTTLRHLGV